ncbi:hypothetical protein EDC17_103611 [Sphingobacterium alimentarium]|uniref:Uncharacterized protein n=1 Tax=Sphingobacterium alimentarium TaxID=797292 RepID=A0A4R3VXQ8_9SPHI|nr:hypothetical protein [Sphingobacterium alimentarium]TCV10166.1 hypothetical protein EDC17_103611 [Sphingobacterium alimentarium]
MGKFEKRLAAYNEKYGDEKKQSKFSYNYSAEQIVYRNEALRTNNRGLYEEYINTLQDLDHEKELAEFDSIAPRIMKLDRASFLAWANDKAIQLVESDIYIFDEDAILKGIRLEDVEDEKFDVESTWNELVHNIHIPEELAKDRVYFWVFDE